MISLYDVIVVGAGHAGCAAMRHERERVLAVAAAGGVE